MTPQTDGPVRLFAALGEPTRLALVSRLADGEPRSITTLADETSITRQAVTKHLRVLEDAGLVRSVRKGRESRYGLQPQPISDARAYLDQVSAQWDAALQRLRAFVEDA